MSSSLCLLIGGLRLAPAIWIAALIANLGTAAPTWTGFVIATGNALEAIAATWWLRQLPRFDATFRRVADVLAFILIAAIACTAISATLGVLALSVSGVQPWSRFPVLWFNWWLGDALGAIIVAPAILGTWSRLGRSVDSARAWLWIPAAALVTHLVFGRPLGLAPHPTEYVIFPVAIGAAVSGGPLVTSWVVLGASTVAIWHTVAGSGPFASIDVHYSLILLQAFLGVLAATSLLLAAAVAERRATEHRERAAAEGLRRRQELLRLAQRAGGVATFEWDFRNEVATCSAEFFRLFGLPAQDGVMTGVEWGRFVHPEDRERMATHLARVLEAREPAAADYRILAADGVTRWLSYAGQIERTSDGDRLLGTVVDISDRKRAEAALRDAKLAAEAANRVKDQFLATLSHELRTPLNAILGYARMLQTDAIAPEKRQRAIEVIERNAAAQNQLVEELLDMARITTGKVRLEPVTVPVATVLRESVDVIKPAADARGIALHTELDPFAGSVLADTTRLQQVFWNLLTNAVKFTSEGGRVAISLRRVAATVQIAVTDTGRGISPDFLPFVFEPFRQGDSHMDRAHGGLGLGLAITKQLVELHGGTIHVASAGPGCGATFTITLPRVDGRDADADPPARPPAGHEPPAGETTPLPE